jgi:transcriptional regulator with XRE-family HTH domain
MNPLYELRERLNLSRVQFGKLVDKSEATIEKYEAEISPEFAAQLAKLAERHGYYDLALLFNITAGNERAPNKLELAELGSDEIVFLRACLSIYRNPENDYERSVVTIVRELIKLKEQRT